MKYLVTNFAYGHGPYLRTTELALALNAKRRERGQEPFQILVPWVYGEKQKRIMLEEFEAHAGEISLDAVLGSILKRVFYGDSSYEEALGAWVHDFEEVSQAAHEHLSGTIEAETLAGVAHTVSGSDIVLELSRAPRIAYDISPTYGATFGHISEILSRTLEVDTALVSADRNLIKRATPIARKMEYSQRLIGLAEPGTFSYIGGRTVLANEVPIPPTTGMIPPYRGPELSPGVFVTITGIPGLDRLYREAEVLGLTMYSNAPEQLSGSVKALPGVVASDAIKLHFARSGWGSVWLSMLLGKAVVVPEFDPADDPEIYFNNLCIEALGIGIVYRGEPLADLIEKAKALESGILARNKSLLARFSTLDGNEVMAELIASQLTD